LSALALLFSSIIEREIVLPSSFLQHSIVPPSRFWQHLVMSLSIAISDYRAAFQR